MIFVGATEFYWLEVGLHRCWYPSLHTYISSLLSFQKYVQLC